MSFGNSDGVYRIYLPTNDEYARARQFSGGCEGRFFLSSSAHLSVTRLLGFCSL